MSRVSLTDDETKVIFSQEALRALDRFDADDQATVIQRLLDIVETPVPPGSFVREQIINLDIISFGSQGRLYTKVVEGIPDGDSEYHIVFLFFIDIDHDYTNKELTEYSIAAERRAERVVNLISLEETEEYLDEHDALGQDELRQLLPE